MDESIGSEGLEEHARFVRRLAAHLVRDPHRADDVAQETWLRWFFRPPHDRSQPRRWLARVTRGVASNQRRREGRRADVERDALPPEPAGGSPLDSLRQAEAIERVAAAVRALEEPYRAVVLARYFRGLSVRELAHESGTSEDTLRTRERRALEQLRAKLDRDYGTREGWSLALGPFLEGEPEFAEAPRGPAAAAWVKAAGLLLCAGALVWIVWPFVTDRGATQAKGGAPELASLAAPAPALVPAPAPTPRTSVENAGDSSSLALLETPLAELRGRVQLENDAPATGARIVLEGEFDAERGEVFGESADWTTLEGVTEADGTFALRFAPPRAYSLMLGVLAEGHADAYWNVAPEPGSVHDLGTLTLERGATLSGRIVDADGAPVLGGWWQVGVDCSVPDDGRGRNQSWRLFGDVERTTGEFRLEHVPAGAARISASSPDFRSEEVRRLLLSGVEERLDLVVPRTPPSDPRRLSVQACWSPDFLRAPALEHVRLRGDDGREWRPRPGTDPTRFEFEGLGAGLYTLEITDPLFEPWTRAALEPGTTLRASLRPCSRVTLTARDAAGELLPAASLTVGWLRDQRSERLLHEQGEFDGTVPLFPGDAWLRVRSGGREARLEIRGLGYDETRACEVVLNEGASVVGRLVGSDGRPHAHHDVYLLAPASVDDADRSGLLFPGSESSDAALRRRVVAIATTDAEGAFQVSAPAERELLLHAHHPGNVSASSARFTLAPDEARRVGELVLPDGANLAGRLVTDAGVSPAGLRLWVAPAASTPGLEALHPLVNVTAEGRFELDGLPAGAHRLALGLPTYQACASGTTSAYGVRAQIEL